MSVKRIDPKTGMIQFIHSRSEIDIAKILDDYPKLVKRVENLESIIDNYKLKGGESNGNK